MYRMGMGSLSNMVERVLTRAGDEHVLLGAQDVANMINQINQHDADQRGQPNNIVPLTARRIHQIVQWMRLRHPDIPIITVMGRWGGYAISSDEDWLGEYRRGRFGYLHTALTVFQANMHQELDRLALINPQRATLIRTQVDRLLQDIAAVI